jgi:hypothetical protein
VINLVSLPVAFYKVNIINEVIFWQEQIESPRLQLEGRRRKAWKRKLPPQLLNPVVAWMA